MAVRNFCIALALTLAVYVSASAVSEGPGPQLEHFITQGKPFYTRMNMVNNQGVYEGANKLVVDLVQHQQNLALIKERAGASDLWATVKGDAYGMGMQAILINSILSGHVTGVGTAHVQEAEDILYLTPEHDFPVMVYAASTPADMKLAVSLGRRVIPWVFDGMIDIYEEEARKANTTQRVILACNTGMNRYGVEMQDDINEAVAQGKRIMESENLELFAVAAHFPVSDSPRGTAVQSGGNMTDEALTLKQIGLLLSLKDTLKVPFTMANSGATLQYPQTYNKADGFIRPGILQYGICPNQQQLPQACKALGVKPVFHIETHVTNLHRLYPGQTVCYGRKYTCCDGKESQLVATVPIGYCDGIVGWADNPNGALPKVFSINGTYYPIAGKRSMDSVMLLVDESVSLYDTVKIRFPQEDFLAEGDGGVMPDFGYTSISYLPQRLTRQYVFGEQEVEKEINQTKAH